MLCALRYLHSVATRSKASRFGATIFVQSRWHLFLVSVFALVQCHIRTDPIDYVRWKDSPLFRSSRGHIGNVKCLLQDR